MTGHMTFVFRGDDLIGQDPRVVTWGVRFYYDGEGRCRMAQPFERYTVVTLSTQPDPQAYVGVAIYCCCIDHGTNVGWLLPNSELLLSEIQAKVVREWLIRHNLLAWEYAAPEIRSMLGEKDGDGAVEVPREESLSATQLSAARKYA